MVHAYPPDSAGGVEVHVEALAAAQAERHEVAVFTRVRRPEAPDLTLLAGASRGRVAVHAFNHLGRAGQSFRERTTFPPAESAFGAVRDLFRPDVVHVHHLAGLSAGILRRAASGGARVVMTIHDHALACPRGQRIRLDLDPCPVLDRERCTRCVRPHAIEAARAPDRLAAFRRMFRAGEGRRLFEARDASLRAALDSVAAFVAPSRSAVQLFHEFYPAAAARASVIPHGLPATAPAPRPPYDARPFVVATFGALHPNKGTLVLAQAARLLARDGVRVVFNGGGDPGVARAVRWRSRGRAVVAGPYEHGELSTRMASAHAVAVPSLWPETFSLAVREGWAHQRPVLASRTGALIEAAGPGEERAGLVEPGDVGAWVAAIRRLSTDRAWYARLAGPHAPESFDAMITAIEGCYTGTAR